MPESFTRCLGLSSAVVVNGTALKEDVIEGRGKGRGAGKDKDGEGWMGGGACGAVEGAGRTWAM